MSTSTPGTIQQETGDVVDVVLAQHRRIRALFSQVTTAGPEGRQQAFDELRGLLAVHEAAEEMVLRRHTSDAAGGDTVADMRNAEEKEASRMLAELEDLDALSPEFLDRLSTFEAAVLAHASNEETEELPLLATLPAEERASMGEKFLKAERMAPTHPHPTTTGSPGAVMAVGPFASMLDRAKDALTKD